MGFSASPRGAEALVRVVLADDSAVVRGLSTRWLSEESGIALVGTAVNGREAIRLAVEHEGELWYEVFNIAGTPGVDIEKAKKVLGFEPGYVDG